jgi:hypothetical protein
VTADKTIAFQRLALPSSIRSPEHSHYLQSLLYEVRCGIQRHPLDRPTSFQSSKRYFHLMVGVHVMMRWPLRKRHHAIKIDAFTVRKYAGTRMNITPCVFGLSNPRIATP